VAEFLRKLAEVIRNWQLSEPEGKHCHMARAVGRGVDKDLCSSDSEARDGKV